MTYIAFLKGINVTGHKLIKMAELKVMFEKMNYKNVRTYIQSGNVVFEVPKTKPETLRKKIEAMLNKAFGFDVIVVIRTKEEIEEIIKQYPFSKVKGNEECKKNVAFLDAKPDKSCVNELEALSTNDEIFKVSGDNVYQLCRSNFADSLMGKNIIEKKLKVKATVRNWNTVNKILNV